MIMRPEVALLFLTLFTPHAALAQRKPPEVFVDKGACPFECCQYGKWGVEKAIPAYLSPSIRSKQVTVLPARSTVTALTGRVRVKGQPFVVARPHEQYKPGDKLMVYTYYGEGAFLVWYKGRRYTEDLGFSPYGGTGGERCTDSKYCWGTLSRKLQYQWWVRVRLADRREVWVRGEDGFNGQDACG